MGHLKVDVVVQDLGDRGRTEPEAALVAVSGARDKRSRKKAKRRRKGLCRAFQGARVGDQADRAQKGSASRIPNIWGL